MAHRLVAVGSSSGGRQAAAFVAESKAPNPVKSYGSYAEVAADPSVDIVYIASPTSHHFQHTMLALEAGKHVLCEKAMTVTAAQGRRLAEAARERNLFLMEALMVRFFPLSHKTREIIRSGDIGKVRRVLGQSRARKAEA